MRTEMFDGPSNTERERVREYVPNSCLLMLVEVKRASVSLRWPASSVCHWGYEVVAGVAETDNHRSSSFSMAWTSTDRESMSRAIGRGRQHYFKRWFILAVSLLAKVVSNNQSKSFAEV